jgi:hypothetical protein
VLWDASGSICIPSVGQDCGLVVCHQCYWRRALGDLSKIRMLTPCERNTRRIGSLQSPSRAPVGEVIGVAVVVDDGQLRSGGDK